MRFIYPSTCSGPRGPTTSSGEQNLNGEPSCDGRESAGPDDRGHSSARPVEKDAEDSLHDFVMPCEGREDSCKPSSCLWVHDLTKASFQFRLYEASIRRGASGSGFNICIGLSNRHVSELLETQTFARSHFWQFGQINLFGQIVLARLFLR